MATENTPINEDDDLFNFDEMLARRAERPATAAAAPAVKAAAPGTSDVAPAAASSAAPTKPVTVRVEPAQGSPPLNVTPGQIGQVKPLATKMIEARAPASVTALAAEPMQRQRVGALTLAILLMATLVNLALVGVVWRSMSGMGDALREVGDHVARANETTGALDANKPGPWQDLKVLAPQSDEAELALATAAEEIRLGDYERARARLYSLLSVIDRFDAKLRANLASRAQVLAAHAFREQADAIERQASLVEAPGFVAAPMEKHP